MAARERKIERYLGNEIKKLGGMARKWTSPGRTGVPDQIIMLNGDVWFVEVKTPEGAVSGVQKRELNRIRNAGCNVAVVRGSDDVDSFIKMITYNQSGSYSLPGSTFGMEGLIDE